MSLEPPAYQFLDAETTDKMLALFQGERTGWVQVGEKKWLFPHRYVHQGKHFYNFKARPDDTWVLSFPRSGGCTLSRARNRDYSEDNSVVTVPLLEQVPLGRRNSCG